MVVIILNVFQNISQYVRKNHIYLAINQILVQYNNLLREFLRGEEMFLVKTISLKKIRFLF